MPYFFHQAEYLGTQIYVRFEAESKAMLDLVFREADRIEQDYSRFIATSKLSQLNQNLDTWTHIDPEFFELCQMAQNFKIQTGGIIDCTVKSTLDAWGYDEHYSLRPKKDFGALGDIALHPESCEVKISAPIDFGCFGKGYFLDQTRTILHEAGVKNYFINGGGDIYAKGEDATGPWKIYFEDPRTNEKVIGETVLDNFFACSSSPSRRAWRQFHHLIDIKNQKPADRMKSVYVQSNHSGAFCDAMSTALFVMGFEEAQAFTKKTDDLEALLVSPQGQIWQSKGFKGKLYTLDS